MRTTTLLFDFDGLIIDTETPDFIVLSEQYAAHGATLLPERWIVGLGTHGAYSPYAELAALIDHELDYAALTAEHRKRYKQICEHSTLQPGVLALLEEAQARGLGLAVASSSTQAWVEGWLEQHNIRRFFRCIRTREDVEHVKPAPELFLSAAACMHAAAHDCVVLEDSINGMRAAAAAGMRCIAVPIKLLSAIELPPVTMRLDSLDALKPATLLDQLGAHATNALQ